ncbi:glycoside hydrolase family 127 protein [Sanguibacter sp. YZGR15]|uniref:Glycoside hydrolase family 127 protein n=1 Tax=Sanguibacter suaedae TaxID=2795737 RepID=A0A934MA70_9MICO|nr:glycoside hydrolase family 127 protein [Sanguibacter suaedae]
MRLDPEGYLGRWQDLNATATIPHSMRMLEESGTLDNLRRVVGRADGDFTGYHFADSDVHKLLEAIGWEIARTGTRDFDEFLAATVALLEEVQDDDGYLDSHFQGTGGPGEPRERFADLRWGHELYCAGHMIQAAVALSRAGRGDLLVIARRTADLLVRRAAERGVPDVDGHPEAETALVELYRHTGEQAYLDLAEQMIEARGRGGLGPDRLGPHYFQDHAPVRDSTEATGHAVRQLYLDAGVTDLYTERGDRTLLEAMVGQWETAHHEKMYVTGAMGSRHFDESFGDAYELPPDRAYAETCASIADVQWSWRMLLVDRDARYADAMERALHNSIRSSLSQDGTAFFYSNPLHLRAGHREEENAPSRRTPWYRCACCPPNIARLVASLAEYVATSSADTLSVHLYGAARIDVPAHLGTGHLVVRTAYPQDGDVHVVLDGELRPGTHLALRVPAWARDWTLTVDGTPSDAVRGPDGYVTVDAGFGEVRLVLPMPVDLVVAHPRVDAVRGCVAITRGPVVYCLEQADHEDVPVEDLRLRLDGPLDLGEPAPGGLPTVRAAGAIAAPADGPGALYTLVGQDAATPLLDDVTVTAVPYADWGNRETGPMRVWVPVVHPGSTA